LFCPAQNLCLHDLRAFSASPCSYTALNIALNDLQKQRTRGQELDFVIQ